MESKNKIGIHFGLMADPLEEQLNKQGFTLDGDDTYQRHVNSVLNLWLDNILTDKERCKCFDRLFKRVCKHAKPLKVK